MSYNLTKLKLHLTVDHTSLYYEQGLPLVTNILNSHKTIRLLQVQSFSIDERLSKSHWRDSIQQLFQAVLSHPSLEYIGIQQTQLLQDTFKEQKETLYKRSKQPPPIIDIDKYYYKFIGYDIQLIIIDLMNIKQYAFSSEDVYMVSLDHVD